MRFLLMITNNFDIPLPLVTWLLHDSYDHVANEKYISATQLLRPTKEIVLSHRVKDTIFNVDVSQYIPSAMGTALHDSIEKAWFETKDFSVLEKLGISPEITKKIVVNPEKVNEGDIPIYIEQRAIRELDGWQIGGKFDFIWNGQLYDFKSTSAYTWVFGKMNDKYCKQGSIYRWLNPDKITSEYIKICFIFTDWNNQLALANKDYPQCKICYKDIPLMSLEETEGFIKNKLYEIENYFDKPEEDIPRCSDDDLWRRDAKYKYYSKETATRATKVFDTPGEARAYCALQGKGFVKEVKGEVKRCPMCPAFTVCKQRGEYFA